MYILSKLEISLPWLGHLGDDPPYDSWFTGFGRSDVIMVWRKVAWDLFPAQPWAIRSWGKTVNYDSCLFSKNAVPIAYHIWAISCSIFSYHNHIQYHIFDHILHHVSYVISCIISHVVSYTPTYCKISIIYRIIS